ncbi:hypothetical protein [Eudoraea chungangensis]|nr:hypothetical protein [Eudoraea chungangensis]
MNPEKYRKTDNMVEHGKGPNRKDLDLKEFDRKIPAESVWNQPIAQTL